MALTDPACKKATCPEGKAQQRHPDAHSLYLEVRANGGKYWFWKYRFLGKERRLALGVYPGVTLKQAREARDVARATLKDGTDPAQQRKDRKLAAHLKSATTFEGVARAWWAQWKGNRSPRHADYVIRRLEADVFPAIGSKPVADVTAAQLLALAKKIEARGASALVDAPFVGRWSGRFAQHPPRGLLVCRRALILATMHRGSDGS